MSKHGCQIHCLQVMPERLGAMEMLWQKRNKIQRVAKRRLWYVQNMMMEAGVLKYPGKESGNTVQETDFLEHNDLVRVRSWEEVHSTLNRWNQLKGCAFMEEMRTYCGTVQRVFKRVDRFLDERDYLMKKTKNIYLLENVFCEGTKDFGPCDRSCFYFWRREWLERMDPNTGPRQ